MSKQKEEAACIFTHIKRDGVGGVSLLYESVTRYEWMYELDERDISTRRGLIRTIRHLTEKNWITIQHIQELIDLSFIIASGK